MKELIMTIIILLLSFTMVQAQNPMLEVGDDMLHFDRLKAHVMETWEGQGRNGQLDYYYDEIKEDFAFVVAYRDCDGKTEKQPFVVFNLTDKIYYNDNHPIDGKIDFVGRADTLETIGEFVDDVHIFAPPCSIKIVLPPKDLKDLKVGDDMPDFARSKELFHSFVQWASPDGSKYGGAIIYYSVLGDFNSAVAYEAYLICDEDLADLPFGVYAKITNTLYLDNIKTDGEIDSMRILGENERPMVYEVAPECE